MTKFCIGDDDGTLYTFPDDFDDIDVALWIVKQVYDQIGSEEDKVQFSEDIKVDIDNVLLEGRH